MRKQLESISPFRSDSLNYDNYDISESGESGIEITGRNNRNDRNERNFSGKKMYNTQSKYNFSNERTDRKTVSNNYLRCDGNIHKNGNNFTGNNTYPDEILRNVAGNTVLRNIPADTVPSQEIEGEIQGLDLEIGETARWVSVSSCSSPPVCRDDRVDFLPCYCSLRFVTPFTLPLPTFTPTKP